MTKISDLALGVISDDDSIPILDGASTKRVLASDVADYVNGKVTTGVSSVDGDTGAVDLSGSYDAGVDNDTTQVTVSNTTTETDLLSASVADVAAGDTIVIEAWGTLLNNTGSALTYQFRFKIGSTTVTATNAGSVSANAAIRAWHATIVVQVGATTAVQKARSRVTIAGGATATSGGNFLATTDAVGQGSATEDWSTAKVVALTAQMGAASSSGNIILEGYTIRRGRLPLH